MVSGARAVGLVVVLALAGCDVADPPPPALVVEAFVETGRPLPAVTVRRTAALEQTDGAPPVADAVVTLEVDGEAIRYAPVAATPGTYAPSRSVVTEVGTTLRVITTWEGQRATAASRLPPTIAIDSVRIVPDADPVEAVFADSLGLDLREGVIYSVTATVYWTAPSADTAWVRAHLRPPASFPSAIVDFVLSTDETQRETDLAGTDGAVLRSWSGTYAVPVESLEDPLPPHMLEVALVRSGTDYARYVLSRTDPGRREPVGNVDGGTGIVAGVSIARRTVLVGE